MNINFPYLFLKETESTNLVALELLSKINPPNGFLIITDYQTAGKGQYGRIWQSERGKNLLFSLILPQVNLKAEQLFRLHLSSSLAIIRTLNSLGISQLKIKWPNDIYANDKKLAGILIQNQLKGELVENSVIGIGININQSQYPEELNATSLILETGIQFNRDKILQNIRNQILNIMDTPEDIGWNRLMFEYNSHLYFKDQMIAITTNQNERINGMLQSVTEAGKLRIYNANSFTDFSFGEIQYHKLN